MKFGIISDIHEDLVSLKSAIHQLEKEGCNEIICTGDIIGFSIPAFAYYDTRNANECIKIVQTNCKYAVAGNHDLYPVKRIPKFNAGFNYPANWFELEYEERKKWAGEEVWLNEENELNPLLSLKSRTYLKSLKEYQVIQNNDFNIFLSHYLYPDLSGSHQQYFEAFGPVKPHLDYMKSNKALIGFSGHKHIEGFFKAETGLEKEFVFGTYEIQKKLQWIVGPCIANGKTNNGFMTFDLSQMYLKVIPLNSPPRKLGSVFV
ncbi:MAG: metallophosphoesterase [Bacteroidales bacterium]|nr:metallophosphoesterase [Bacteroidales bacterium]MCF8404596.1 metallophosphoesterase [Bacteroidales bacterium]